MRAAALASLLLLSACAAPAGILPVARDPMKVDYLGNVYPAACADLSSIDTEIKYVGRLPFAHNGLDMNGLWLERPRGTLILILEGLPDWKREETIRHERCHEMMFRLTGRPEWH